MKPYFVLEVWLRIAALFLILLSSAGPANALQKISNCILLESPDNDGDSFLVRTPKDGDHIVRLYYVDCPETTVGTESDVRRVQDQTAYFGLPSHIETITFGRQASERARDLLQEPFTIHTVFASAGGRSAAGRIYAFVRIADGRDLAELLVSEGLARSIGMRRETPEGIHRDEAHERMQDLELAAALGRKGIWARSEPERLVELRAAHRAESEELREIQKELRTVATPTGDRPDLNSASQYELLLLPGIGPVRAKAIIDHRPYRDFDDLLKIKGIGPHIVNTLRQHAILEEPQDQ